MLYSEASTSTTAKDDDNTDLSTPILDMEPLRMTINNSENPKVVSANLISPDREVRKYTDKVEGKLRNE